MKLYVRQAIKEELYWLGLILFIGLLLGFLLDHIGLLLLLSLAFYIVFHIRQSWKVLHWLSKSKPEHIPSTYGIYGAFVQQAIKSAKTNQKRKKRLSALLKRFNEVLAAMPDAIVILDEFGGIEWFNGSARRLLKMTQTQDIGQHITRSIQEKNFTHYYTEKKYDHSINIYSPFDPDTSLNIRIAAYGKKKQLLSARDITRMRQLEGMRSLFVANVSHELRTPLTVVSGYLELLSDSQGISQHEDIAALVPIFQQMEQQTDRMTTLLDDLLMLANLENEQVADELNETICISDMIRDIYREVQMIKPEEKYTIQCDIDHHLAITGNAKELHSAFTNLLTNALRYTPSGGEIIIRWKKHKQTARFSVQDNGIGIEAKHINRLTERFYRVDKGRSRSTGGTGLGLAIVKHVLFKHDANLDIKSVFGQGSCFTCIFPQERIAYCE